MVISSTIKPKTLRRAGGRERPQGGGELPRLLEQRDRLFEEARRDPESDAAELVRTFLFTGMMAPRRAARRGAAVSAEIARLEAVVGDQKARLDQIARAAQEAEDQKLDPRTVVRQIAEAVGLIPSSQAEFDEVFHHTGATHPYRDHTDLSAAQASPSSQEDTCQTQNESLTPKL